ncbi:MAG: PD-(D/E)XK nuclease family protein [Polyangiales bacterium]
MSLGLMSDSERVLHVSACAAERRRGAVAWLAALPARDPALLLVPSPTAGLWLVSEVLAPGTARFAWRRLSLEQHCQTLALPVLLASGRSYLRGMAAHALCTRILHELRTSRQLGRFAAVSGQPGFVRTLWQTLSDLRMAGVDADVLEPHDRDLARCLRAYAGLLEAGGLCDLAALYAIATERAGQHPLPHWLALDIPVQHAAEAALLHALGGVAAHAWISVPDGDERCLAAFRQALGPHAATVHTPPQAAGDLARLQARLFANDVDAAAVPQPSAAVAVQADLFARVEVPQTIAAEVAATGGGRVRFIASPGESREAVEVVREILVAAHGGVRFDRMAVLVRAVDNYRAVLEEAFARAKIPAHFDAGVRRPTPEGRAFALLLACAERGLSARRFAEYLSLGVMPRTSEVPPSPRRWERLLVEASVAGGRERWARRLQGLARRWQAEIEVSTHDAARRESLERQLLALGELTRFALPLLEALESLPQRASCDVWLPALQALAERALHEPSSVRELLLTLGALGQHTELTLRDVSALLAPHLNALIVSSEGHGAGQVFVASVDEVRGRSFERVFVLGLAEKLFPPRVLEDPLLPDRVRRALSPALACLPERVAQERLALRLAVGAASEQLCLTFPRFDSEQGRPRVPSFYGLEALEATLGRLIAWRELSERAEQGAAARLGWPAPEAPGAAIDDAEYDLAILEQATRERERSGGALSYLLAANPFLARALRFRARRWELPRFVPADGFIISDPRAKALFAAHALSVRSYSANALAQLAVCPYRFYLHAVAHIAELDTPSELTELDPRERGLLFHEVLNRTVAHWLAEQASTGASITPGAAQNALDSAFAAVRGDVHERYAPAIARVFDGTLRSLRRDLWGWLERNDADAAWLPQASALSLQGAAGEVALESGLRLSGAIDLVERQSRVGADGRKVLRATDFKTGAMPPRLGVTQGAHMLSPLLYALALERIYPDAHVSGGRLYYCSHEQRYKSHEVPLGERARDVARQLLQTIGEFLEQGFLPAAPERDACASCEFAPICGPHEEERVGRVKQRDNERLRRLELLRRLP